MTRVLVVGAGLSGLAAGIGLHRAGFEVQVFDQASELQPAGFGIGITGNGMKALDLLGAYEAVVSEGCTPEVSLIKTWQGKLLRSMPTKEIDDRVGYPIRIFHRADLQRALLSLLPDDCLTLGSRFTGFEQSSEGVRVKFDDGSEASGDVLVGADGVNSRVRQSLHGPGHGDDEARFADYVIWVATMKLTHPTLTPGYNSHYWGAGSRVGIHDIGGGHWYWWCTENKSHVPERLRTLHMVSCDDNRSDKDELLHTFAGWAPEVRHAMRATPAGQIFMIHSRDRAPITSWGVGRASLLGDAAHPMLTSLGQGAGMGFEDAAVLVSCLRQETNVAEALLRYERLRIPRTTQVVEATRRASAVEQLGNPVSARARNWLVGALPNAFFDKQAEQLSHFDLPEVFPTLSDPALLADERPPEPGARRPSSGDRLVVITGASTGIGRAIAIHLARAGYRVLAGVRSSQAADDMLGLGLESLEPVILDVVEADTVAALVADLDARTADGHRLEAVINNAGVAVISPLEAVDAETLQQQFAVNTTGANVMVRALLPYLLDTQGYVLNVGSPVGATRPPFLGPYAASKAALEALTDVWRRELGHTGIRFVQVVPGPVMTPVWHKMEQSVDRLLQDGEAGVRARHGRPLSRFVRLNGETAARSRLSTDDVAAAVLSILGTDRPRHRYDLGRGTTAAAVAARTLPSSAWDAVYQRLLKQRPDAEVPA